jgi:hypothetical protein
MSFQVQQLLPLNSSSSVRLLAILHALHLLSIAAHLSLCRLRSHAEPRLNARALQRPCFPRVTRLLVRFLLRRQASYLLDRRKLDAPRCVFAVQIDRCANRHVLAAYRHQPGQLDVVY